jgi:tetratricopeptide (TPR) repeat protein
MKKMNIRYRTFTATVCCTLLFTACSYDKKRIVTPNNTSMTQEQGLETSESIESKSILQPPPLGAPSGEHYVTDVGIDDYPGVVGSQLVLPDMQYVKDRIFEYGRKLDRWKELDEQAVVVELDEAESEEMVRCFRDLQKVLNGYNRIQGALLRQDFMDSSQLISSSEVMELEQRDISFLESGCGHLLKGGPEEGAGWAQREEQADLPQIETLIERYAGSEEYEEVVQVWQQIPDNQLDRVHLNTRISYGNALMALHQEAEAAKVYQQIVDQMSASDDQRTDILSLRRVLADLYAASGDYKKAEKQYNEISNDYKSLASIESWGILQLSILERSEPGSPELEEYSSLLRNYLGFTPQRDGYKLVWQADQFLADYPYSAVASNIDIIRESAKNKADDWLASFLAEVDVLAAEERFQDALLKMETLQEDILSGEKLIEIRKKSDDLTLAEAVNRETKKIEKMQALQREWNDALLLIDKGDYDEAIELLTTMLDSEYGLKADGKIAEASLLSARAERRKAADLFIRFTKTTDRESQKKLLIDSRRHLVDILVKYPDVGITDKVMGNIERVEKEMNTLDPNLLAQAELVGGEEPMEESRSEVDAFDMPVYTTPELPVQQQQNMQQVQEQNLE